MAVGHMNVFEVHFWKMDGFSAWFVDQLVVWKSEDVVCQILEFYLRFTRMCAWNIHVSVSFQSWSETFCPCAVRTILVLLL